GLLRQADLAGVGEPGRRVEGRARRRHAARRRRIIATPRSVEVPGTPRGEDEQRQYRGQERRAASAYRWVSSFGHRQVLVTRGAAPLPRTRSLATVHAPRATAPTVIGDRQRHDPGR